MWHGDRCCRIIILSNYDRYKTGQIRLEFCPVHSILASRWKGISPWNSMNTLALKKGSGPYTADSDGKVCAAIYATPHFIEDGTLAFIMRDRLSHHNLHSIQSPCSLSIQGGRVQLSINLFSQLTWPPEDHNLPWFHHHFFTRWRIPAPLFPFFFDTEFTKITD